MAMVVVCVCVGGGGRMEGSRGNRTLPGPSGTRGLPLVIRSAADIESCVLWEGKKRGRRERAKLADKDIVVFSYLLPGLPALPFNIFLSPCHTQRLRFNNTKPNASVPTTQNPLAPYFYRNSKPLQSPLILIFCKTAIRSQDVFFT
jgi:hypothetical protein